MKKKIIDWRQVPLVFGVDTASMLLGLHPETIKLHCKNKKLPAVKVGSKWRFNKDKIIEYLGGVKT